MTTELKNTARAVMALENLRPSETTNRTMTKLVDEVVAADNQYHNLRVNGLVRRVRHTSAEAETEMEFYWSKRIAGADNPTTELRKYPYLDNYRELIRRELELTEITGLKIDKSSRILAIGSGPLPLSSYQISQQTGGRIDNLDCSDIALLYGDDLMKSLGELGMSSIHGSGDRAKLRGKYDLVLIAALAGNNNSTKQAILDNIMPHLSDNGRILIRSARNNRLILYPEVNPSKLKGVDLLLQYHPTDYVINSVLIFRGKHES